MIEEQVSKVQILNPTKREQELEVQLKNTQDILKEAQTCNEQVVNQLKDREARLENNQILIQRM